MKKLLCGIFTMLSCVVLYAQGGIGGGSGGGASTARHNLPQIIPQTPDVMAMQKYGEIPVGHYTGTPNINVPIYTIQAKTGVSVPIAINYHGSGIKVDEKASRVGLGWSLSPMSVISKRIIGRKDNGVTIPNVQSFNPNFYNNRSDYDYALGIVRGHGNLSPIHFLGNGSADAGYDIYSYNILGRSGKFIIDRTGKVHTIPYEPIKIIPNATKTTFVITDENGTQYFLDRPVLNKIDNLFCNSDPFTNIQETTSLYLRKIVTHIGEEILFNYKVFNYEYMVGRNETNNYVSNTFTNYGGCTGNSSTSCVQKAIHADNVLSSIVYNNTEVQFSYSDETSLPIQGSNVRKDLPGNHALRKVTVKHKGAVIKTFELQYGYFYTPNSGTTSDSYRLKLTNVIDNNVLTHSFEYNETVNLPKHLSYAQDFWGFYNGKPNTTLIPQMTYGSEILPGADRSVSSAHTQANILQKIIYPTKGYSTFEYENNTYYDAASSQNKLFGGLRVKKIDHFDGVNHTYQYYDYAKPETGQSSGIKQGEPIFSKIYIKTRSALIHENSHCKYIVRSNSSVYPLASDIGKYVGYTYVTVRNVSNTSNNRTIYKFENYGPDYYTGPNQILLNHTVGYSWKKGKLKEKISYNASNEKVFKEENRYTYNDHFASSSSDHYGTDKIAGALSVRLVQNDYRGLSTSSSPSILYIPAKFEWNFYFIKSSWVQLSEQKQTTYFEGDSVQVKTNYFYKNTDHAQLTKTITTNSKGEVLKSDKYYPHDLNQTSLINQHRIGAVLQQKDSIGQQVIGSQKTIYKDWGSGVILPEKVQSSKGSLVLEDRVVYHSYDDRGNPREVSKADGTKVYYVWGYDKTQPIAKIEGVTGASLSSSQQSLITAAITASNNDTNAGTEATLRTKLSALRNGFSSTPWVQVTTLTYDPLIGVTSITDARGNVMYYVYDSFNRLQYIKDKDGYVLKEHKYHYKN